MGCGVGGGTDDAAGDGGWVAGMSFGEERGLDLGGEASPGTPPLTGLPEDSTSRYPNVGWAKLRLRP